MISVTGRPTIFIRFSLLVFLKGSSIAHRFPLSTWPVRCHLRSTRSLPLFMAVELKPLFNPEIVRQRLLGFALPASVEVASPRLQHWAALIASGKADTFKETELLPEFLTDIFGQLLGYTGPAGPGDSFTLSREAHVEVDGQFADAVLGRFSTGKKKFVVAVEGKSTRDPLDRPFAGRRMSAVDQAYRYAINLPCDWILVTSMRETRLYHKGSNQQTYERFETIRLASDPALLKRFVFSSDQTGYARDRTLSPRRPPQRFRIRRARADQSVLPALCRHPAAGLRPAPHRECRHRRARNPPLHPEAARPRPLLCLLRGSRPPPADTVRQAFSHHDPYNPRPIWENFRGLFRSVDGGNAALKIPAYNGGLFAPDPGVEALAVPDAVCALFRDSPTTITGPPVSSPTWMKVSKSAPSSTSISSATSSSNPSPILSACGRISKAATLSPMSGRPKPAAKKRALSTPPPSSPATSSSRRSGPCCGTVSRRCASTSRGGDKRHRKKISRRSECLRSRELNEPQRKALIHFWEQWQEELKTLRILDPACGSGAFLIETFDQLHALLRGLQCPP
jgi:hypothetical protein